MPDLELPADDELIQAWHGPDSTAEIASEFGVKGSWLENAFRRLKREGRLPNASRQRAANGRTQPSDRPADIGADDRLLNMLIQIHGRDDETGVRSDLFRTKRASDSTPSDSGAR